MSGLNGTEILFVAFALGTQVVFAAYFALRKWQWDTAMRVGWSIYALSAAGLAVSGVMLAAGQSWDLWIGGIVFAAWGVLGYVVDIARPVQWRNPIYPRVLFPYVTLYLVWQMFYWWPLGNISRPLWFVYAALFLISSVLNLLSHGRPDRENQHQLH